MVSVLKCGRTKVMHYMIFRNPFPIHLFKYVLEEALALPLLDKDTKASQQQYSAPHKIRWDLIRLLNFLDAEFLNHPHNKWLIIFEVLAVRLISTLGSSHWSAQADSSSFWKDEYMCTCTLCCSLSDPINKYIPLQVILKGHARNIDNIWKVDVTLERFHTPFLDEHI